MNSSQAEYECPECVGSISALPSLVGESSHCPNCGKPVDRPASCTGESSPQKDRSHEQSRLWWYDASGEDRGPVTEVQLRSLAESGMLRKVDLIWREGSPEWIEARLVSGLFGSADEQPVQPPKSARIIEYRTTSSSSESHPKGVRPILIPRSRRRRKLARRSKTRFSTGSGIVAGCGILILIILVVIGGLIAIGIFTGERGGKEYVGDGGDDNPLIFNGGEVFYTSEVTKSEAVRLGRFLVRNEFFDGEGKSVQLDRSGRTYVVRFVVKKGVDIDAFYHFIFRLFAGRLSRGVFNSEPVEIHLCDEWLNTLRVVQPF